MRIDADNLPAIALGCSLLGAGGGGDVENGLLACLQAVAEYGPVEAVDLDDLPDEDMIMPCGNVGSPMVGIEKIGNTDGADRLRDGLERWYDRKVAAIMASEIGGSNGLRPIAWAASMGLPMTDADGMGRAFPEIPQVTMEIAGIPATPGIVADERGNWLVVNAIDGAWAERIDRALAVAFGGSLSAADYIMTVAQARTATARGTTTLAEKVGRAMLDSGDPIAALESEVGARRMITGKIVDVEYRSTDGFYRGAVLVEGLKSDAGRLIRIEIQNENLVVIEDGVVRAMVPDIITVLDTATGKPIHTERLRYGQRVTIVALPCNPIWRTEKGLALAGPRAFGYDIDYVPIEEVA
jgi:uncharacterized protein